MKSELESESECESEEKNQSKEHRSRSVSHSGFRTGNGWIVEPNQFRFFIMAKSILEISSAWK
jgi:hypothetical protein